MIQLEIKNQQVLAQHVRAEKLFDMQATLATLMPDCIFEDVPTAKVYKGRDAVRSYYQQWWQAFRNVSEGGTLHVVDGNTLIAETRFVGRHEGQFEGIEASGQKIDLPVVIVVTFSNSLMQGERFYYDRATLLRQIGALAQ